MQRRAIDPADRAAAGGASAIASTLARVIAGPGLRRGAEALAQLNQARGFDCPGCAWPDPRERARHRVLRERREGGRARGHARAPLRRVLRALVDPGAARAERSLARAAGAARRAAAPRAGRGPLCAGVVGRGVRGHRARPLAACAIRTRRSSTPRAAPATRPPSCTSCSRAASAPTTCPTARTCVTSRAASASRP